MAHNKCKVLLLLKIMTIIYCLVIMLRLFLLRHLILVLLFLCSYGRKNCLRISVG